MIDPKYFCSLLAARGTTNFFGVPDSLLKDFCAYITDNAHNTICCNEGAAVGMAVGNHLATGAIPAIYMQNSGLGNTVNPILSLADPAVYSIPLLMIIGWRGEPGFKDEPQHKKQGIVTLALLDAMDIPYVIASADSDVLAKQIDYCYKIATEKSCPVAVVIRKGTFTKYVLQGSNELPATMTRESAIEEIMLHFSDAVFVSTTGMISRELFEMREKHGQGHEKDFLTVGGMGHASSIALSIAAASPFKTVVCLDGDGASLMHLGSYSQAGTAHLSNFFHIVLNNGAHDSVGGQPTVGRIIDLCKVAQACGYKSTCKVETFDDLKSALGKSAFLEVVVKKGARADLGRPTTTPKENKIALMQYLK